MPKQDEYDHLPIGDALRKMANHHYGALRRHITGDEHDLLNEAADLLDEAAPYHFAFTLQVAESTPFPPGDLDLQVGEPIRDLQVGERLRQIRREKHLSLQEVEARSDAEFKASVLGAYERGERSISVDRLQRLALFYDVPLDDLWFVADDGAGASGDGGAAQRKPFSKRQVGDRIRLIRRQQGLSLQGVESLSGAEFKASVLGAYERGERSISVDRLQRLALFYEVPVEHLWPVADDGAGASGDGGAAVRDTEGPDSKKELLVAKIAQRIGVEPPQSSTGSTVTKEIFLNVNEALGLGLDEANLSKPALARAIVESAGHGWSSDHESGGGTVTTKGLEAVLAAVETHVGAEPKTEGPKPTVKKAKSATERLFGHVPGIKVGTEFTDRRSVSAAGVHRPTQAGISGSSTDGADSIVVSGGYVDDSDSGDLIIYTGHGGIDVITKRQVADQQLARQNMALVVSCERRLPVRVVRGWKGDPVHSPDSGYRYDGLYSVTRYWSEAGVDGYLIWRFELQQRHD